MRPLGGIGREKGVEKFDIFQDMAERTGGDIYIGVVGPVRTGKSTFIKKFMDLLVLPNIPDEVARERTVDELPQSGAGRTVMTTEPKFVPDEGVNIVLKDTLNLRVRLVDSVGFPVEGASGYLEDEGPRMVMTPWFDYEVPFEEAAEMGTRKVITDHSTLGLVVTTDGSFGEIPRESFEVAEERVINELRNLEKPFAVLLNSARPHAEETVELAGELREKYDVPVIPVDCQVLAADDVAVIMEEVLYEFPVQEVRIDLPPWIEELDTEHAVRLRLEGAIEAAVGGIQRLRDVDRAVEQLGEEDLVEDVLLQTMDMGSGVAVLGLQVPEAVYYQVLSGKAGVEVEGPETVLRLLSSWSEAKQRYDKLRDALEACYQVGYGVVIPDQDDMVFEEPEIIKKGGQFGVRLKAGAPSLHIMRADVESEISPMIGSERQSEQLIAYLMEKFEDDPQKIWQSDIFGKPLYDLLREGVEEKIRRAPEGAREKLRDTLQKVVNEGSGGIICIII